MFSWLKNLWKDWKEGPKKLEAAKLETKQKLDQLHSNIQSEKISDSQLTSISVCLEAATIKLKPGTARLKGGGK